MEGEEGTTRLRQKFQSKKALHFFMVNKSNVFLPLEKNCPIAFLHQILAGQKRCFRNYEVCNMKIS